MTITDTHSKTAPHRFKNFLRSRIGRRIVPALAVMVFTLALSVLFANWRVERCSKRVYRSVEDIPARKYALLLGTSRLIKGKYPNQYFFNRIRAAAELYSKGKVEKIIVSGDNSRTEYNETEDMRQELIRNGVKDEDILSDYAGFRTLDSVIRARNVFGTSSFTVVSQQFHCERAIYIAGANGIDAIGYAAKEVVRKNRLKQYLREPLARTLAFLDVNLFKRKPHFEK